MRRRRPVDRRPCREALGARARAPAGVRLESRAGLQAKDGSWMQTAPDRFEEGHVSHGSVLVLPGPAPCATTAARIRQNAPLIGTVASHEAGGGSHGVSRRVDLLPLPLSRLAARPVSRRRSTAARAAPPSPTRGRSRRTARRGRPAPSSSASRTRSSSPSSMPSARFRPTTNGTRAILRKAARMPTASSSESWRDAVDEQDVAEHALAEDLPHEVEAVLARRAEQVEHQVAVDRDAAEVHRDRRLGSAGRACRR